MASLFVNDITMFDRASRNARGGVMSPFWKSLSIAVTAVPLLAWAGATAVSA